MNHVCSSLLSDNPDPDLYFIFPLIPLLQSNDDCDNAKDGNDDGPGSVAKAVLYQISACPP